MIQLAFRNDYTRAVDPVLPHVLAWRFGLGDPSRALKSRASRPHLQGPGGIVTDSGAELRRGQVYVAENHGC